MASNSLGPFVLVAVVLVLIIEALTFIQVGASLTAAEKEAYYQVDVLLSTESQESLDKDIRATVKSANELLESTLTDIQESPAQVESSFNGEIRGETIHLLKKLISLYQMIERKEAKGAVYAISEEIGTKLADVWRTENKLPHLQNYLVRLVSLIEERNEEPEKGWWSRLLAKLGF